MKDFLILQAIRLLNWQRLRHERRGGPEAQQERLLELLDRQSPLALQVEEANRQHYELPASFFQLVLGPHRKYSSAYWTSAGQNLGDAERAMLELYCERAVLRNGQSILELGCGWGSLTELVARRYPASRILAVSNSHSQREFINSLQLPNVEVRTCDINHFEPPQRYDRILSIEMFEHLRNYRLLFQRLEAWLEPGGKLFAHIFCHRTLAYLFEGQGWMERHFFAGGTLPSANLFFQCCGSLVPEAHWLVDGTHYQRTALAWLANLRREKARVLEIFGTVYGRDRRKWFFRWELFFLACAGYFGYQGGREYMVAHYRFGRAATGL